MKNIILSLAILIMTTMTTSAQSQIKFTFRAAYNWADVHKVQSDSSFAQGGRLVGSWSWDFENGKKGNTHFNSASFFRSTPYLLAGVIEFNMFELEGSAPGTDLLYFSYNGISTDYQTGKTIIEATIIDGKGKYEGASGTAKWISINGFIDEGSGIIKLK
jgi:hypothetical protein